jgi:predicted nucleic acid-binding protein
LIVADSSFLVHGLLRDRNVLESDSIITLDLALHEVVNSVWKHQYIIKDIKQGYDFVSVMFEMIDSNAIVLVRPDRKLVELAYNIAAKHKTSFYDCIFVALAIEVGLALKTMDEQQAKILKAERS